MLYIRLVSVSEKVEMTQSDVLFCLSDIQFMVDENVNKPEKEIKKLQFLQKLKKQLSK